MRNVLIIGSGRSGTSMTSGILAQAGYFMGDHLNPIRESNPKGQFEDREINAINETILAQLVPKRIKILGKWFFCDRPVEWQRWLARIPVSTNISSSPEITERIHKMTQREPYCFKDPRFSYTLPVWRPLLRDTIFICVFREPANTASSILKQIQNAPHLQGFSLTFEQALQVWTLMYSHIYEIHRHQGEWLFLHYNQLLTKEGLDRLEYFTGASVDRSFPDPSLRRSFSEIAASQKTLELYNNLCKLAEYQG